MSIALQAIALFVSQSQSPYDRVEALLARSEGFSAEVKVNLLNIATASGTYSFRRPSLQHYKVKGLELDQEFLQGKDATVIIDHLEHEYTWFPGFKAVVEAPTEADRVLRFSLPLIMTQKTLTTTAPKEKWTPFGTETVDGHKCDILTVFAGKVSTDYDPARIWVDFSGRILRARVTIDVPGGKVVSITDFLNPAYDAPPESEFAVNIPWGYMPTKFQEPVTTKFTGEAAVLGTWTRLPSMEKVEMNSVDPTLVLVTSDDLSPEGDLKRWKGLAERAKRAKVRFVQIWVGKKPEVTSSEWETFWDKDGSFEASFGPPTTPYLFLVTDKALISAWQGWADGDEVEAAASLFSPLKRRH